MKKPDYIIGFIGIYLLAIFLDFLINDFLFSDFFGSGTEKLIKAVAQFSLVNFDKDNSEISSSYLFYSLIVTQLAGIMWLTIFLWCYRKLFDQTNPHSLKDTLYVTLKVSIIIEVVLFLFFLYAIPGDYVNQSFSQRLLTALTLSVNSFNNAGISHLDQILGNDMMQSSYVLQLGVIGGSALGNLGIFVINELFAPTNLRHRLAHPNTDWSFITKISVFGGSAIILIGSLLFFINEQNAAFTDKNLMESIIGSIFEVNSSRGFGYYLYENCGSTSEVILIITNMLGSGPFSTGGGLTILFFPALLYLLSGKNHKYGPNLKLSYILVKNLVLYSILVFAFVTVAKYFLDDSHHILNILHNQWMMFSSNTVSWKGSGNLSSMVDVATITFGRISFIVACYMTWKKK